MAQFVSGSLGAFVPAFALLGVLGGLAFSQRGF
jgi:hypothetical protein